jgi:hypothetical protein
MTKVIEKRDWENVLTKCNLIQDNFVRCITNSKSFKDLDDKTKAEAKSFAGSYVMSYISIYTTKSTSAIDGLNKLVEKSGVSELYDECNFGKLHDCCKETYNLENLKGYYESTLRLLPKVVKIDETKQGPYRYKS